MPELPDNKFLKYSSLGIQLLATLGLAGWVGYQLDKHFHLRFPAFLLGLILIAFVGMMYKLYCSLNE